MGGNLEAHKISQCPPKRTVQNPLTSISLKKSQNENKIQNSFMVFVDKS